MAPSEYRHDLIEEILIVRQRARRFLTWLATERKEEFIVVVCHAGFIRCVLAEVLSLDIDMSVVAPSTGTNIKLELQGDKWKYGKRVEVRSVTARPVKKILH